MLLIIDANILNEDMQYARKIGQNSFDEGDSFAKEHASPIP